MFSSTSGDLSDRVQERLPSGTKDIGIALVLPGLVLFSLFMLYPILYLVYLSLTDASSAGEVIGGDLSIIWFQNYIELFSEEAFWRSLGITWLYVFVSLAIKIVITLAIANVLTHNRVVWKRYMRAIIIIPMGFPPIFTISVWRGIFSPAKFGPVNVILSKLFLSPVQVSWMADRWAAFGAYVITEAWLAYPFMVIITVSALQDVPMELHDAAKVDGAGYFTRFIHVTLPAIRGPLIFASVLTAATSFQNFLIPWVFNEGGPGRQNELLLVYGYREALNFGNYGPGSAIMVVAIAFIGLFMWIAVKKTNLAEGV
ncbi:carbohydrate ABC transporter permease [Natrinema halophilum]|uniref:Sugar ABC transporter permease n=1 Tax=Natrinema halophilum TaxID=1699371 RepID=A0A7D5GJY0_9EURY|nr:sugar ABC transporter permease [Natrinema halophilum]QLG48172.1 sugar ABC transporter permease [Natrinema halophilum]